MTPERATLYENGIWLLTQIDAECEAGSADISRVAAAAEAAAYILAILRKDDLERERAAARPKRRAAWEVSSDAIVQ